VLQEFYQVAFRRNLYASIAELQIDLDAWTIIQTPERTLPARVLRETPMATKLAEGDLRQKSRL